MGSYIYFSSLREFLRFKRLWPWLMLGFFGMLLALAWPSLSPNSTPVDQYAKVSEMLVFHVLALSSAIFTSSIVSQEVEQKTIVYLLTRPVTRWLLILMRYLASATVVALLGIFGALLVSFAVYKGHMFSNELLRKDVIALVFGAFAYGGLFLLVSLLINRAMILCLLFAFGWETIVPQMPGEMYRLSLYSHLMGIADHPSAQSAGQSMGLGALTGTNYISPASAYMTLLVLTSFFVTMSAAWFTRSEIVPREDAE
jgi:ABC-2 type transport system permease protein